MINESQLMDILSKQKGGKMIKNVLKCDNCGSVRISDLFTLCIGDGGIVTLCDECIRKLGTMSHSEAVEFFKRLGK